MNHTNENLIRTLAYQIWESEGCPHGQDKRHWEMAGTLIQAQAPQEKAKALPVKPPARRRPAVRTALVKDDQPPRNLKA